MVALDLTVKIRPSLFASMVTFAFLSAFMVILSSISKSFSLYVPFLIRMILPSAAIFKASAIVLNGLSLVPSPELSTEPFT